VSLRWGLEAAKGARGSRLRIERFETGFASGKIIVSDTVVDPLAALAPERDCELRDLDLSRPRDGLAAYLLAKQMQNRAAWQECAAFAASALRRELPGPLFVQEALRMRGIAAWHVGDDAAARAAFTTLGKNAPPGRAVEVDRWLDRLR